MLRWRSRALRCRATRSRKHYPLCRSCGQSAAAIVHHAGIGVSSPSQVRYIQSPVSNLLHGTNLKFTTRGVRVFVILGAAKDLCIVACTNTPGDLPSLGLVKDRFPHSIAHLLLCPVSLTSYPIAGFNKRLGNSRRRRTPSAKETIMSALVLDKKADLAGPGIGDYRELEKIR